LAISVAVADPPMPMAGIGPTPRISSGLSPTSTTDPSAMNLSGVIESPVPRNAMVSSTVRKPGTIAMKMIRR